MNVLKFSDLGPDVRASLQGHRWLLLTANELEQATAALAFSELEDVLVAVDHRRTPFKEGGWVRAVHLLVLDEGEDPALRQRQTGITKVVVSTEPMEELLW